jgi:hypothetical protein
VEIGATLRTLRKVERRRRIGDIGTSLKDVKQLDVVDQSTAMGRNRRLTALHDDKA